jgi:hypothetical protein
MRNKKSFGNLVGGFITILVGMDVEQRKRLKEIWIDYGYGFRKRFNDRDFRDLIKMAVNGELK